MTSGSSYCSSQHPHPLFWSMQILATMQIMTIMQIMATMTDAFVTPGEWGGGCGWHDAKVWSMSMVQCRSMVNADGAMYKCGKMLMAWCKSGPWVGNSTYCRRAPEVAQELVGRWYHTTQHCKCK
jgi:hypothetical protein